VIGYPERDGLTTVSPDHDAIGGFPEEAESWGKTR